MFNNRMLAVAAVLVMAVPALGAATPIVVPPVPEQLVEGHTVFTVIEIVKATQTFESRFAAAVAVLVREYAANEQARRFPGVLWFNDQYLVNPSQSIEGESYFRYPCGGAVLAVNAGDPDPRIAMMRLDTPFGQVAGAPFLDEGDLDTTNYTYSSDDYWSNPTTDVDGDGVDDEYYYGQNSTGPGADPTDYAWIGLKPDGTVYTDTVLGTELGSDYDESYLITDPNDHSWVIDKYNFYTRDTPNPGVTQSDPDDPTTIGVVVTDETTVYSYPVWAVNILGSPRFVPDGGSRAPFDQENCQPFADLLEAVTAPAREPTCGLEADGPIGPSVGLGVGTVYTDDPCMGYMEPSRNGYCYGGQPAEDADADGDVDADDCLAERTTGKPLRQYNALLYFKLEDLTVREGGEACDPTGYCPSPSDRDHSDPVGSIDTNGCSEEVYWWGTPPPEYPCPADDDDNEGNSHPFHPSAPVHEEEQDCLEEFAGPNPTNHGGSTYISVDDRSADADGWYNKWTPCDYAHATRNIDIYFSGAGRPWEPVVRSFAITDLEGSAAPFQDFHSAYPGVSP